MGFESGRDSDESRSWVSTLPIRRSGRLRRSHDRGFRGFLVPSWGPRMPDDESEPEDIDYRQREEQPRQKFAKCQARPTNRKSAQIGDDPQAGELPSWRRSKEKAHQETERENVDDDHIYTYNCENSQ